jgi:hypothetical protein
MDFPHLKSIISEVNNEIGSLIDEYESLFILINGLKEMADIDDIDGEEYINLLSKLTKEMELVIRYSKDIKDCFEKFK